MKFKKLNVLTQNSKESMIKRIVLKNKQIVKNSISVNIKN